MLGWIFFIDAGDFTRLAGEWGEIVPRRETPSQCGRVGSPDCYLEFKLRYLKNLKLFLSRVKELLETIVLRGKKGDGFCSF